MEKTGMSGKNDLTVNGYYFGSPEDAETARQEVKKIAYLEEHMDYGNSADMLAVYKKALDNRIFQTPVGWEYLKELQKKLKEQGHPEDQIPPITMRTVFANRVGDDIRIPAPRLKPKGKKPLKRKLVFSVFFNILLLAVAAAMFGITLTSGNPNILNYEKVLQNRYAAWEQELSAREAALRERERQQPAVE